MKFHQPEMSGQIVLEDSDLFVVICSKNAGNFAISDPFAGIHVEFELQ